MKQNPFRYGSPVSGSDFIDREDELATVFQRLSVGDSSSIIGEPHVGKTSFLLRLKDHKSQSKYVGQDLAKKWYFSFISGHEFDSNSTPKNFWDLALEPIRAYPGNRTVSYFLKEAQQLQYEGPKLQRVFEALKAHNRLLILLLDEFECLLSLDGFKDPAFFGRLRGLSTRVGGIALVVSSRYTVRELNEMDPVYLMLAPLSLIIQST